MKGLRNKLGIGLLAGSLGLGGCLTPQGEAFLQGVGFNAVNTMVSEEIKSNYQHNYPGDTNVNVNNQVPQQSVVQIQKPKTQKELLKEEYYSGRDMSFTCNFYRDFNNDGSIAFDEYFNIKDKFGIDEKITIIGVIKSDLAGKILEKELLDSNGSTVMLNREPINNEQKDYVTKLEIEPAKLKEGVYTAIFSAGEKYFTRTEFEVVE